MRLPKLKMLLETVNDKNRLVAALKKNSLEGAKDAITSMMRGKSRVRSAAQELSMGDKEFAELTKALQDGDIQKAKTVAGIAPMAFRGPFADFMEPNSEPSTTQSKDNDEYPVSFESVDGEKGDDK